MAKKILIADDNALNREIMHRRLEREGFDVVVASTGKEALSMARSERPSLILMDMSMPMMNGWDATRHLREDESLKHIPVIALTANAMMGDRERSLEAGCDEYESKPVDFPSLLKKISILTAVKR
jgi:CheY-like chemotaxis protein